MAQKPCDKLSCRQVSFCILMRQYHERNINRFPAFKQHLVEQRLIGVEKSCKMPSPLEHTKYYAHSEGTIVCLFFVA
jgi:hypothetical protein